MLYYAFSAKSEALKLWSKELKAFNYSGTKVAEVLLFAQSFVEMLLLSKN